ncbi:MAG: o-succinylbenzoate synthase [Flavobacteriaceae bacterium]|nr:o-succinylbenzoate synthase [Flavobacteriaceae bacterium]
MDVNATYQKYILNFKRPSGTSRGILKTKETWFLRLQQGNRFGIGECGLLRGLSSDDRPDYEDKLKWTCRNIHLGEQALYDALADYPSIQIGVETAFRSLGAKDPFEIFPSEFSNGTAEIPINGLVWMGDKGFMKKQISEKISAGFSCIKLKIGAIDFDAELDLLKLIRRNFSTGEIEIRVDANGAFSAAEAREKLNKLSQFHIHSIEQPIAPGQKDEMARLCEDSPLPIALDEELIGVTSLDEKEKLLQHILPQYIILKPSLVGGFRGTDQWIEIAETQDAQWWITSALESNVGLNAISQYTYTKNSKLPQGLGTGGLYTNNIPSPLEVSRGKIKYNRDGNWNLAVLS